MYKGFETLKAKATKRRIGSNSSWADEKVLMPGCRLSYPRWVAYTIGAVLLGLLAFSSLLFRQRPPLVAGLAAAIVFLTLMWRKDSSLALRSRLPNKGWKSQIQPEMRENLSPEEFNAMRFELKGLDDGSTDEHRVPWVSRYSRVAFFHIRVLIFLAGLCLVGALRFPYYTDQGSGADLPHTYHLTWIWVAACPLLLFAAWLTYLEWDYRRIMLDDRHLYLLRENPAWMPWIPGKNDPIPLSYIWSADPRDSWWGKHWGHGTVELTILVDYSERRRIRLRRVPRHRDFCNVINDMTGGGAPTMAGGMMR
jgi:hypothetical protein